jgi:hypothetical protein
MLETFRFIIRAGFFMSNASTLEREYQTLQGGWWSSVERFNARVWISHPSGRLMKLWVRKSSVSEVGDSLHYSSSVTIEYLHRLVFFLYLWTISAMHVLVLSFSFIYFLESILLLLFLPSCIRFFNLEFNLLIWKCTN